MRLPIIMLTAAMLASPAFAADGVTIETISNIDYQARIAGLYCDGEKCVGFNENTTDLPDTIIPGASYTKSFGGQTIINWHHPIPDDLCLKGFDWACDGFMPIVTSTGIQRRTVKLPDTVIDGGTVTTCTRTKVAADYNGPDLDAPGAWTVTKTVATLAGGCSVR